MTNQINIKELKSNLKKLLQKSLGMLTKELSMILSEDSAHYDDFIIINGRLKELERDDSRGTISKDKKDESLNNIRAGLLRIINLFDKEDLKGNTKKEVGENGKLSLYDLNNEYESWSRRYAVTKNWIEENFKEFNHWFSEKEVEVKESEGEVIFEDNQYTNSKAKIFGSYLKLSFTCETLTKYKYYDKESNFQWKILAHYVLIFNLLDIEEVVFSDKIAKDEYDMKLLHEIKLICKDGLSKIQINIMNKLDRTQFDNKADWEVCDEEGDIHEWHSGSFSLKSTNKKFLEAFSNKLIGFRELINELE